MCDVSLYTKNLCTVEWETPEQNPSYNIWMLRNLLWKLRTFPLVQRLPFREKVMQSEGNVPKGFRVFESRVSCDIREKTCGQDSRAMSWNYSSACYEPFRRNTCEYMQETCPLHEGWCWHHKAWIQPMHVHWMKSCNSSLIKHLENRFSWPNDRDR